MSRRAKLLITALFLVLPAILAAHLVLTWSPAEPLTFRIVRNTGERYLAGYGNHVRVYEVEVKNTSPATIHFTMGDVTWDKPALERSIDKTVQLPYAGSAPPVFYTGYFELGASQRFVDPLPPCCTIAARSTHTVRLMMFENKKPDLAGRPHFLVCSWMSQTKLRFLNLQTWLRPKLPLSLQSRLIPSAMDETILRIDATAIAAPHH